MSKSKKILVGVSLNGKGGIDNYILSFARVANKYGYKCHVLSTQPTDEYKTKLEEHNAKLIQIDNLHNKKNIYSTIEKLCKEEKYVCAYWNISTAIMYPYIKAANDNNIKRNIVHAHAHYNSKNSSFTTFVYDRLHYYYRDKLKKLNVDYAACSSQCAEWIAGSNIINKKSWTFIPNPIDVEKCTFNLNTREKIRKKMNLLDKYVVGCVTSFMPYKYPSYLIAVFRETLKINPNAHLLIAGEGPLKDNVSKLASEILPKYSYHILGHRNDVYDLLQAFDVFVLPSKNEGLPLCILEAQAADLPCVMSTNITSESVIIKDQVKRIPFKDGAKKWAEVVNNFYLQNIERNVKSAKLIDTAGFNLDSPKAIIKLIES